jgi:hypothetical protein
MGPAGLNDNDGFNMGKQLDTFQMSMGLYMPFDRVLRE